MNKDINVGTVANQALKSHVITEDTVYDSEEILGNHFDLDSMFYRGKNPEDFDELVSFDKERHGKYPARPRQFGDNRDPWENRVYDSEEIIRYSDLGIAVLVPGTFGLWDHLCQYGGLLRMEKEIAILVSTEIEKLNKGGAREILTERPYRPDEKTYDAVANERSDLVVDPLYRIFSMIYVPSYCLSTESELVWDVDISYMESVRGRVIDLISFSLNEMMDWEETGYFPPLPPRNPLPPVYSTGPNLEEFM
jgi:hypothetical protein